MHNTDSGKIIIRLHAGHKQGMGHLFRMMILADHLVREKEAVRFVISENRIAENILSQRKYPVAVFPAASAEALIIQESLNANSSIPAFWIYDMLDTEAAWIDLIRERKIRVVCFDDTRGGLSRADLVINAIAHCWGSYRSSDAKAPVLEGIRYAIIDPSVRSRQRQRSVNNDSPLRIGIALGGSDTHGSTLLLVRALARAGVTVEHCRVFTGPHFLHQQELSEVLQHLPDCFDVRSYVPDLHKELDGCDVVICNGGTTLFEVCAMGLPALAFANEAHEEKTISCFSSSGLCLALGAGRGNSEAGLAQKLADFLQDSGKLSGLSASCCNMFHDAGVERCVQAIRKLMSC